MRRALKFLFAFLGLVIVAAIAAVLLIPREQIVELAADQVRAATGRELALSGELSPSFWPVLGVRTGPVTLSNAEWAGAEDMVSASGAEIGVELMPLVSGEIRVTTLRLVDPVVELEIGADGRANWEFDGGAVGDGDRKPATAEPRGLPKISLPEAVISNGTISFMDARSGQRIELAALDLTAGLESIDAPLRLKGAGLWNGERSEFEVFVDTPAAAMEGQDTAVRLALASDRATLDFEGDVRVDEAAALPLINGTIAIDLPDPAAAMAWATGTAPPAGMADLGAVKFDGSVGATEAALKLTTKGSVGYKGRIVDFDLSADGGAGWLQRRSFEVAAAGRTDGLFEATFSGPVSAGDTFAAEGPLKLRIADLRGLAEWTGGAALDAPAGTLATASLDAKLALTGADRIVLSGLAVSLDRTRMTGAAGVDLGGPRPTVTARLESGPLDLSPFMASGGGAGGGGGTGGGWSTEPPDLSGLHAIDADVAIRAEAVDLGEIEIGRSDIAARLRDGRLDMTINRVDAYGGGIAGTVALVAGEAAQLSTDLTVSAVQLRPLLSALAGIDTLEGLGALRIRLDGRGRSMDALMKSLDGRGALELSDGGILGLNLAAMVRNLTGRGGGAQRTDFSAITGSFDITEGVLHNTDFSFLGPLLRVIGAGTVDIGRQAQNFRLEPTAVASLTGQGGALDETGLGIFPVLVTGTWSNPSFKPDLTAAIQGLLTDPDKTLDAVRGLAGGADAGTAAGALLGTVTGSATGAGGGDSAGSSEAAIGSVVGSLLGAGTREDTGGGTEARDAQAEDTGSVTAPSGDGKADAVGTLIGALIGGSDGRQAPAPAPLPGSGQPVDATALAPRFAPLPVLAPGDRWAGAGTRAPASSSSDPAPQTPPAPATEDKLPGYQPPATDKLDAGKIFKDLLR